MCISHLNRPVYLSIYYLPALLANVQAVFITASLLDNYIF